MTTAHGQAKTRGREPKLTFELVDALAADLEMGLTYNLACDANGISRETFRLWMSGEFPKSTSQKLQTYFFGTISRANATFAKRHMRNINEASDGEHPGDWRASTWALSNRFRDEYGEKSSLEVSGDGGGALTVVITERKDGPQ